MKYYAGIGSREIDYRTSMVMQRIASLLEKKDFILRSGGANGADNAFEIGVKSRFNMNIHLPHKSFNGRYAGSNGYIYLDDTTSENYRLAYESLKFHPSGFKISASPKNFMIRNFFQVCGYIGESNSEFIVCWTKGGANGYNIKTTRDDGGTGQAIRIASSLDIPVYNLKDPRYEDMIPEDIVDMILSNLKDNINPDKKHSIETTSLF